MVSNWTIYIILFIYMGLMYFIAGWGDKQDFSKHHKLRGIIYSLSLAVYCTSWTFFGAVGTAAKTGWSFLPIYLGPILLFTIGWPLVKKIIAISKAKNVTSIADFIASLYEKSRRMAVLVTCIAVCASIPYIALQLEAISSSLEVIAVDNSNYHSSQIRTLIIAALLAFFSIIFGTKKLDVTEHHRGLMMAIAFESFLKLIAFIAVGLFVMFFLYSGPIEVYQMGKSVSTIANGPTLSINFISQCLLAFLVFMCLPRQFHVTVVENENRSDLKWSRWVFVVYLIIFSTFVIPIAMAGNQWLGQEISADLYVLKLPMMMNNEGLTLLVLFGGLAAATGMVIISTIALSTMVSNDLVLPLYLKLKKYNLPKKLDLQDVVLWSRRISIFSITFLAYLVYFSMDENIPLASFGNLSFLLTVQFAPALLLGIYWQKSNKKAAFLGMITGVIVWAVLVLFPHWFRVDSQNEYSGILYTLHQLTSDKSPLFQLISYSLLSNFIVQFVYVYVSELIGSRHTNFNVSVKNSAHAELMTNKELKAAVRKIIGKDMAEKSYKNFSQGLNNDYDDNATVSTPIIQFTERLLAGSIGSSSARAVITALLKSKGLAVNDIVELLDETSQAIRFQRRLTDATLDSISQGVSVVDSNLRLVAWNKQYLSLLNYPEGMVYKGMAIEELIRFNASRGLLGEKNIASEVEKRLIYLRKGTHYRHERSYEDTRFLQIEGNPMPDGGYVTTYTDVSHYKKIEKELIKSQNDISFYTDYAPAMLAYVDKNNILKFANKAYLQFFSFNSAECIGQNINELHIKNELNKRKPYLINAMQGKTQSFELELTNRYNKTNFVLGTYVPDKDKATKTVNGIFVIIQDISTRRKAELELQRAKENLEQRVNERTLELLKANEDLEVAKQKAEMANSSKTKFIADASHDLLQPFNAARLFSSLLTEQTETLPEDIKQTVTNLDQSLRSAENLLGALLDIAKIDAGGVSIDKSDFNVQQLFDHLNNQYHSLASQKGLKFIVRTTKHHTHSDQKLLYRVLQNLSNNALKYTDKGGVLVACRKIGQELKIYVIDTGVGLNEKEQELIFHDFLRLHNSQNTVEKGLGLGLSIVDRILHQLGHKLSIQSIPGKGSSFCLTVPYVNKQINESPVINKVVMHESIQQAILCIDNETQILQGMQHLIQRWGHKVECASGSQQAIELFDNGLRPAVLLVDYHLDDETGIDVIEKLFNKYDFECPVVIITANRTDELKQLIEVKNYKLLLKPIKPASLRNIINQISLSTIPVTQ